MKTYGTTVGWRTRDNYIGPYHWLWDLSNESMLGSWMSESHLEVYSRYQTRCSPPERRCVVSRNDSEHNLPASA
jgi:hypothetical protein